MKPEINLELISRALAGVLAAEFPTSTVYDNPNQQKTKLPAWFINFMPGSSIKKQVDNRYMRTLRVDLVYLDEYNLPDLYDRYKSAAERLDEVLELFAYDYDGEQYLIRTYDRQWKMDLAALHYELRLEIRVSIEKPPQPKMEAIEELSERIK